MTFRPWHLFPKRWGQRVHVRSCPESCASYAWRGRWVARRKHRRLVVVAADCSGSTSDGKIQTFSAQGMAKEEDWMKTASVFFFFMWGQMDIVMTSSNLAKDNLGYIYIYILDFRGAEVHLRYYCCGDIFPTWDDESRKFLGIGWSCPRRWETARHPRWILPLIGYYRDMIGIICRI